MTLAWEELEDLAGDVALEAAHDEGCLLPFFGASFDVGLGVGVGRHAAQDDGPQGAVGLAVAAAVQAVADALRPAALRIETAIEDADMRRLWAIRHAASPILAGLPEDRRSLQVIEDGCVPIARLGEYVRAVREAAARRRLDVVLFGHAGDGHLHCNLLPEVARAGWEAEVASLLEEVTDVVAALGGTPSGEHGDGRLRAPLRSGSPPPAIAFRPATVMSWRPEFSCSSDRWPKHRRSA